MKARIARLGDIAELLPGRYLPRKEYSIGGRYTVYGSNSVMGTHDTYLYEGPLIILSRIGTYCGSVMWSPDAAWVNNNASAIRVRHGTEPRFIYYWLKSQDMSVHRRGSGQPFISHDSLAAAPILLPDLSEQRAIVDVLGALDDKIEANARLVPLLRDLAKALLQQAAEGGPVYTVSDAAEVRKGLSYTGAGLVEPGAGMPMVNLANAEELGWLKRSGFKYYSGAYKPRHVAEPGSLLVSGVDLTWRLRIIGWPMLLPDDAGPSLFSHHVFLVDFRPEHAWLRLPLWAHLFTPEARARLEGMIYGTTVATLPAEALTGLEFPVPHQDDPTLKAAEGLLRRAWAAERESTALAQLRDTLLPPLISGELRVRDTTPQVVGSE